ncbi:MAG: ABC transporter ATP-binding protein [Butyrivibrio sp.]|nr:ABC transporter ATP-binding protein [Butyrivibrio sp.]
MGDYVIETSQLTKMYQGHTCVDEVNIHVPKGRIYGLLGRNGAGKTTTMKMLLNLVKPTSGSISIFNKDYLECPLKTYRKIGALIENPCFYENLTGAENLKILAKLRGQHRKDTIEKALSVVGLDKETHKTFGKYSLGMKQRLGIAAAIMHEPEILILDEPINGLDPIGIHEIRNYLLRSCNENGTTIFISSHVLSEIEQIADIIGVMHEGHLLEETNMNDLHKRMRKYVEYEVSDVHKAALVLESKLGLNDYTVVDKRFIRLFPQAMDQSGCRDSQMPRSLSHGKFDADAQSTYRAVSDLTTLSAEVNSCFIENGIAVAQVNIREEKLEDYFSNLIGGGKIG